MADVSLPPGFVLDAPAALPPGFVLDAPQYQPHKSGLLKNALESITSLPGTYSGMVHEALGRMKEGAGDVAEGFEKAKSGQFGAGLKEVAVGAGHAGLAALDYIEAPINAPIHTMIGKPVEKATGSKIAGDLSEFAATLALPLPGARGAKIAEDIIPTTEELHAAAKAGFKNPEIDRLVLKPQSVIDWKNRTQVGLNNDGFNEILAPKTFGIMAQLDKVPQRGFIAGKNLETLRRQLGEAAKATDLTERAAATRALRSLDAYVARVPKNDVVRGDPGKVAQIWNDARSNYAAAKRSETVQAAVERAKDRAGSSYSGMNIDNVTRQEIKSILKNPKVLRGFSKEERDQMRLIDRGTFTGNIPRWLGNFLYGSGWGGYIRGAAPIIAGTVFGHPMEGLEAGALPLAVGYAFKKLGNKITADRVAELDRMVRSRSPLGPRMMNPVSDWGKAGMEFETSKTAKNFARLLIASRNLSNNLADVGINISAKQLQNLGQSQSDGSDVKITPIPVQ